MKIHPNGFTLEEFLVSLSRQHLEVVDHLVGCATCRRRFQGLVRQRSMSKKTADILQWPRSPAEASARAEGQRILDDRQQALAKERSEAPGLFVELTRLPAEQRELLLSSVRFQDVGPAGAPLGAKSGSGNQPFESRRGVRGPGATAFGAPGRSVLWRGAHRGSRARAWAYIGNSRRLRSDLKASDEAFLAAYEHFTAVPRIRWSARFLWISRLRYGEIRGASSRLPSSCGGQSPSFWKATSVHRAGRSLVNLSTVYHYAGDAREGSLSSFRRSI